MKTRDHPAEEKERANEILAKLIFVNASEATHQDEFDENFVRLCSEVGLTGLHLTLAPTGGLETTLRTMCDWHSVLDDIGVDKIRVATTADDVREAKRSGRVAVIFGIQDASPLGPSGMHPPDLRLLRILSLCQIKVMQLAYNYRNPIADGADERTNSGLSKFGVQLVEEMNREGMIVDLSHVGSASTLEAIELSKDPVIFSHSAVRALCDHFRNISDEQIKAVAEKRGFIGIPAFSIFLRQDGAKGSTVGDYLDHIDYVAKLVGVDYVGIGTDIREQEGSESFTSHKQTGRAERGIVRKELRAGTSAALMPRNIRYPKEFSEISGYRNIICGLVARGYSDQDVSKIIGENFLRVFKRVCG